MRVTGTALPQRRFLMTHIDSIEKLAVLLLLQNRTERLWAASEVALELRITQASAAARLADLASSGLLVSSREAPAAYRYSPAHSDDVRAISELATTYSERRVSVITFIFVPPLCASGYGLGTSTWSVAGGAALLFLTNMVAIVLVATVAFIAVGFNRINVAQLEQAEFLQSAGAQGRITWAISRRLEQLFEARWGHWLRVLMPFMLLANVYVPLRRALDEVAWQIRVRNSVRVTVESLPQRVVESRVRVGRREVEVLVILLGKNADAEAARSRLDGQIRQISGVTPRVDVLAVADASALAGIESILYKPPPLPPPAPPSPAETLDRETGLPSSAVSERSSASRPGASSPWPR